MKTQIYDFGDGEPVRTLTSETMYGQELPDSIADMPPDAILPLLDDAKVGDVILIEWTDLKADDPVRGILDFGEVVAEWTRGR